MDEGGYSLRKYMVSASLAMLFIFGAAKFLGYLFHLLFANYFAKEVYGQFITFGPLVCS